MIEGMDNKASEVWYEKYETPLYIAFHLWAFATIGLWRDIFPDNLIPVISAFAMGLPASAFIFLVLRYLNRRDQRRPPDGP